MGKLRLTLVQRLHHNALTAMRENTQMPRQIGPVRLPLQMDILPQGEPLSTVIVVIM